MIVHIGIKEGIIFLSVFGNRVVRATAHLVKKKTMKKKNIMWRIMKMNNDTQRGMGLTSVLTLIFIVLKLCKVITWSWWWVLSPIWISWGLALVLILFALMFGDISDK